MPEQRKVLFKKWIPQRYIQNDKGPMTREPGTGCVEPEFSHPGIFHQWGVALHESDTGFGTQTVAIVELPNGEVIEVDPHRLKFVKSRSIKYIIIHLMWLVPADISGEVIENSVSAIWRHGFMLDTVQLFGTGRGWWYAETLFSAGIFCTSIMLFWKFFIVPIRDSK